MNNIKHKNLFSSFICENIAGHIPIYRMHTFLVATFVTRDISKINRILFISGLEYITKNNHELVFEVMLYNMKDVDRLLDILHMWQNWELECREKIEGFFN